mmetsp:Transcript_25137/g.54190  ORF Transcript_25137/g.54190 Transcript_25137/m.54190 type:complete len:281 (+) Transcript_25137:28-870(+)
MQPPQGQQRQNQDNMGRNSKNGDSYRDQETNYKDPRPPQMQQTFRPQSPKRVNARFAPKGNFVPKNFVTNSSNDNSRGGRGNFNNEPLPPGVGGWSQPQRNNRANRRQNVRNESQPQYRPELGDEPIGFGYGGIRRLVDRWMNPYAKFGGDRMMDRVNSEMARSMTEDQRSIKALLADARTCLLADPVVRSMMGADLELGTPFSKSSSSTMINGVTKSHLQLGIPVSGSQGTGSIRLLANQDGISQIELDAGGRVIEVSLNKRGRSEVIDASVLDRETYS